jgi:signal transduction histidine kinase
MTLLLDSIRLRTILTLFVGLTASHLASAAISSLSDLDAHGRSGSSGLVISTLVMAGAIIVFAWWASSWITAPLADFAVAAERLGTDVNAPPLLEDGPTEVRKAARAFNQMQRRIRSFVDDRLRMLAAIAHDLRSPITRVRLRIEQVIMEPETQRKILADLDEMAAMVESSLAFARDEAADEPTQLVDLSALLSTICDGAIDAGENAEFQFEERCVLSGRPLALKRLFANLVENAIRYGGSANVAIAVDAHTVQVTVDDTGPGVPESEMENVFKPFYRIDRSRNKRTGGVGLGLATARSIARAHGGDVFLANRSNGGLRVIVRLHRNPREGH